MTEDWERRVRRVVDAWADIPQDAKPALMAAVPELYWAVADLAAHGRFTFNLD